MVHSRGDAFSERRHADSGHGNCKHAEKWQGYGKHARKRQHSGPVLGSVQRFRRLLQLHEAFAEPDAGADSYADRAHLWPDRMDCLFQLQTHSGIAAARDRPEMDQAAGKRAGPDPLHL